MQPPPDAPRSPDGYYWWDENAAQWQPVDDGTSTAADSSTSTAAGTATAASTATDQTSSPADPSEGGGTGVAEHLDVEGTCEGGELSSAEIDDILAAAGVSTVES